MTEEEIIKAMELCKQNTVCTGCPYISNKMGCQVGLIGDALNLIFIQRNSINALHGQVRHQRAEIERLQKEKDSKLVMCIANDRKKVITEAIKEFAEQITSYLEAYIVIENTREEKELYKFIKDTAEEWE